MTSREALQCLYIGVGKAYTGRDIYKAKAVLEKNLDDLEKYEKALEIIAKQFEPSVMIKSGQYYVFIPNSDLLGVLSEEEGKLLFELFGGTNYDSIVKEVKNV